MQTVSDAAVEPRLAPGAGRDRGGDGFRVDIESDDQEVFLNGVLVVFWFTHG